MVRRQKLTDSLIKTFKNPPQGTRLTIKDLGQQGLDLRITPNGVKSWSVAYRVGRKTTRYTFGRWPSTLVKDARVMARDVLRQRDKGEDPQEAKRKSRLEPDPASVREVGDAYLAELGITPSERHVRLALTRDLYPALGKTPIAEVTKPQIDAMLAAVKTRANASGKKADAMVNRVRAVLSVLWSYAIDKELVAENPVLKTKRRDLHSRDRVPVECASRVSRPSGGPVRT